MNETNTNQEKGVMFITKKHISRRTVLRGAGATLALPASRCDDAGLDGLRPNSRHTETPIRRMLCSPRYGAWLLGSG